MTPGVTISHPHGNPNSYHAARAFAEAGLLRAFEQGFTNCGFVSRVLRTLSEGNRGLLRDFIRIPEGLRRQHLFWEAFSHLGRKFKAAGPTEKVSWYDILFCGHDWQVSNTLRKGTSAVYAYEDGARRTFRVAKQQRAITMYELPLGYHAGVAHELGRMKEEAPELQLDTKKEPLWKIERKDDELLLADLIVVPCKWAEDSLRFSGIAKGKSIIKVPYGTPSDEISPKAKRPSGPFTVLFAGQVSVRKGVPYLLDAWSRLGLKNARLWLAGGTRPDESFLKRHSAAFESFGALSHTKLMELMKEADLLVFPSVAEGFGLVIGEAMAAGTPVLTTMNTGGPELITNGREGWCVPAHDVQGLVERIEWAYLHRAELFEMGRLARQRAEQWTWSDYRHQLIDKVTPYLNCTSN